MLAAAACWPGAARGADGQALDAYRLGPGDRIEVTAAGHSRLSGAFEIDGLGNLTSPALGRIRVQGRTVAELRAFILDELRRSRIASSGVTVKLLNFRPFYVYGEINRAGFYPYAAGLTVRRAVAAAGGFRESARRTSVTVIREDRKGMVKAEIDLDAPVLPGDIIEVSRRLF